MCHRIRSLTCYLFIGYFIFFNSLIAQELQLTDGTLYHEVILLSRDAAFVTIQHRDGVAYIPIAKLSHELKRQLNYDPLKAAPLIAAAKRSEESTTEALEQLARQQQSDRRKLYVRVVIKDMEPGGIHVVDAVRFGRIKEEYKRLEPSSKIGESWKTKKSSVTREESREIRMDGISIFGLARTLQPGDAWAGYIWPAGERQIKNQAGMVTSMQTRYAVSPELAAQLIEADRRNANQTKKAEPRPNPFEQKPWK